MSPKSMLFFVIGLFLLIFLLAGTSLSHAKGGVHHFTPGNINQFNDFRLHNTNNNDNQNFNANSNTNNLHQQQQQSTVNQFDPVNSTSSYANQANTTPNTPIAISSGGGGGSGGVSMEMYSTSDPRTTPHYIPPQDWHNPLPVNPQTGDSPCDHLPTYNQVDVGADPNFERIVQQNNRELIVACQQYQIKLYENAKNDINRDNY